MKQRHATVTTYLRGIAALALEVSRRPELLPTFVAIIELVPKTVSDLRCASGSAEGCDATHPRLESRTGGKCVGTFPYRLAALIMSNRAFS